MSIQAYRLLIVDDVPDNLFLLQTILEAEGFIVDVASSGSVALNKIYSSPPDLVLLDVMMPGMNGYEVTQRIREDARLLSMPILLITAHDEASMLHGLELGANGFIRKPIDINELLAKVQAHLRLEQHLEQSVEASNSVQLTKHVLRAKQPLSS